MTTFPLLQLPLVAMEHVLCMMSPFELINVSLASSRAKRCVKNFSKTKKKFQVSFNNSHHSITFHREQKEWKYAIELNESDACQYKCMLERAQTLYQRDIELIIKVSEEPLNEIIKWFDYAREVLHCKINSVLLDLGRWKNENRQKIDWIAAQNRTIDKMSIWNYDEELDDDLKYLMERIHASGTLSLSVRKHKDDFRMEIPGKPKILRIEYSEFIDYNQLLRLKSPVIVLRQSSLRSQEINRFLRSWMSCETHLELEAFKISISGPNAMNQILKLPHEKTNDPKIADAFKGRPFNLQVVNDMFTIKRCDGKKQATVTVENLWGVWSFYLIVH